MTASDLVQECMECCFAQDTVCEDVFHVSAGGGNFAVIAVT